MLWCLTRCGRIMGDESNLISDSGIESVALTSTGLGDVSAGSSSQKKSKWTPGDSPAKKTIEMHRIKGFGII